MNDETARCPVCGASDWVLIGQDLHAQELQCNACKYTEILRTVPLPTKADTEQVRVELFWDQLPSNFDVMGLKRLLPEQTKNYSVSDLLEAIREARFWDAGTHSRFHAEEIISKAKELGLSARANAHR